MNTVAIIAKPQRDTNEREVGNWVGKKGAVTLRVVLATDGNVQRPHAMVLERFGSRKK